MPGTQPKFLDTQDAGELDPKPRGKSVNRNRLRIDRDEITWQGH